ncbi:unnamed protein product [Phaeothamnion confervicola]
MEEYINDTVTQNAVVVFSKSSCPYCHNAKRALARIGCKPLVVELNQVPDGSEIQSTLARMTGRRTVPNVFVGGKAIGGGDDTEALLRSGELKRLVEEAGGL